MSSAKANLLVLAILPVPIALNSVALINNGGVHPALHVFAIITCFFAGANSWRQWKKGRDSWA